MLITVVKIIFAISGLIPLFIISFSKYINIKHFNNTFSKEISLNTNFTGYIDN